MLSPTLIFRAQQLLRAGRNKASTTLVPMRIRSRATRSKTRHVEIFSTRARSVKVYVERSALTSCSCNSRPNFSSVPHLALEMRRTSGDVNARTFRLRAQETGESSNNILAHFIFYETSNDSRNGFFLYLRYECRLEL